MDKYNTKQCSKCKEIKPRTKDYFYKAKSRPDGLRSNCKECSAKYQKGLNANKAIIRKSNERPVKPGHKFCSKCDRELPLDVKHYYRGKNKDGFISRCKECKGSTFGIKYPNKHHKAKEGYKMCNKCNRELLLNALHFHRSSRTEDGFVGTCKECRGSTFEVISPNKIYKAKEGHMFCGKCHKELPLDHDHFYRREKAKNGWGSRCKICWGAKEYGVTHINVINKAKDGHKFCSICKEELPHRMFSRLAERKDGYSSRCKNCDSSISKEYISRPESKMKRAKRFKEWRQKYYATEKGKALNKKHIHLRKSRKANTIYNYTEDIWEETLEHFNNKCAYCGDATKDLQQEHVIPLSKGGYYTKQNIIPACQFCNISKHNRNLMDWYPNQPNYSKDRLDKINKWIGVKNNIQQLSIL